MGKILTLFSRVLSYKLFMNYAIGISLRIYKKIIILSISVLCHEFHNELRIFPCFSVLLHGYFTFVNLKWPIVNFNLIFLGWVMAGFLGSRHI